MAPNIAGNPAIVHDELAPAPDVGVCEAPTASCSRGRSRIALGRGHGGVDEEAHSGRKTSWRSMARWLGQLELLFRLVTFLKVGLLVTSSLPGSSSISTIRSTGV